MCLLHHIRNNGALPFLVGLDKIGYRTELIRGVSGEACLASKLHIAYIYIYPKIVKNKSVQMHTFNRDKKCTHRTNLGNSMASCHGIVPMSDTIHQTNN